MVASEAAPLAKTGGLADVLGALPAALAQCGWEAAVVMPRYGFISLAGTRRVYDSLPVFLGPARWDTSILQTSIGGVPYFLVDCPPLYDRASLYAEANVDYPDNHIRFAVLCRAALSVYRYLFRAEMIHCHDWQAALVPVYLRRAFAFDPTYLGARTLFTIHNLRYQGRFNAAALGDMGLDRSVYHAGALEFWGDVNLLKGALEFSDALSTVSPGYAREIQTPEQGEGLDRVLRARSGVLTGILNGVDYTHWNPETDDLIPARYSARDLSGKQVCKRALLRAFGLPAGDISAPLIGLVSRFDVQKGVGLVAGAAADIVGQGYNLVALGTGDPVLERSMADAAAAWPDRIGVRIAYDNSLAHLIEAGSDLFLMPSLYEPCGLNQMYSLRYGTVPVVRATGGLDDTIEEGTGFKFGDFTAGAMLGALQTAGVVWRDPPRWTEMMCRGMREDFSWRASADRYAALYRRLAGRHEPPGA
jgi:starch synthase